MCAFRVVDSMLGAFKNSNSKYAKPNDIHHRHLVQLGRFFGIQDLSFDESGVCIVSVNGALIKMQMLKTGKLLMTALVDLLPVCPEHILLESLLVTNSRLRARGLSVALEPGSRMIVLQGELPADDNYQAYKRRVERIIAVARELKRNIEPYEFIERTSSMRAGMLVKA